ncbi:MAG: cyclic nucleotide-binding domain-containing protein [Clostridiales bacterium]|nr:cyclic nucleotide-binding domain-containing protein [Clostridiales bacterium]
MNVIQVKAGETVVKRQDKVTEWYLVQEGSVVRKFAFAESVLAKNSIIGIMESEWFSCDYVAREDCSLIPIPCKNATDLQAILKDKQNFRPMFLRTAVEQRHQLLSLYASLQKRTVLMHSVAESSYDEYKTLCSQLLLSEQSFDKMEHFAPITMQHKAENWEMSNSNALVTNYLREYMQLMVKDDSLCVAAIMEASAQMNRVTLGIGEMVRYLVSNKDILCSDSEDDIFHLYFDMAVQLSKKKLDIAPARTHMLQIVDVMEKLGMYSKHQLDESKAICENYNFSETTQTQINIAREDCVAHIMTYAGYDKTKIRECKELLENYCNLPDRLSTDNDVRRLRKEITNIFYEVYKKAFLRSMKEPGKLSPIMLMFFNFGFMDAKLAGESNANALYNLTDALEFFNSDHVYTIYTWLKTIYEGKNEPSRNEFDTDYNGYLLELRRQGEITEDQVQAYKKDNARKVEFEIQNMFQSGNRVTYGRVTTFLPVICEDDIINSVEKMALTSERIENAINKVRKLDYSILYRDVMFSDPDKGINQEWIMKEVMPDVILMPNAGIRSMMWQEVAGAKTDTSARFLFPILTSADVDEEMIDTMGRYRWEICRRIQGVYWNDIREKSLTADYYDYIQFYRKNNDLSTDAKDKIKTALARARNNYREVFVKDYENWIKYESQGSFRLNKVARDILVKYCPFSKEVRQSLASNPLYQSAFTKLDAENRKKTQRWTALYDKYTAAGGEITTDLKENLKFYQL